MNCSKRIFSFIIFIFIILSAPVYADCFTSASARYSVPKDVLLAIASVESGNEPLAINIEGKPYYANGFFQANKFITENTDKSFDVGIMQVNRWWFDKMGYSYTMGLNKCWNIHFGAYILNYEMKRAKGDIWKAVGKYHSAKKRKQIRYVNRVKNVWLMAQNTN